MSNYDPFDQVSLRGHMNLTSIGSMNPRLERRWCGLTKEEREGRIKMYAARYAAGRDIFTGVKLSGVESLEDLFMFDADDDPDGDLDEFDEDDEFDDDDDEFDDDDDDDDDADDDDLDSGWGE